MPIFGTESKSINMDRSPALSLWESLENITGQTGNDRLADVFRLISFRPGEPYGPHQHRRIEINYVKKGSCILRFGDENIGFRRDEMMIINSDVNHRFEAGLEGAQLMQLEFLPEVFSRFGAQDAGLNVNLEASPDTGYPKALAPQIIFSEETPLIKIVNNIPIMRAVERIVHELDRKDDYYRYLVMMYYAELLILIYRYMDETFLPLCNDPVLKKAISFIRTHYMSELSISQVNSHSGVSGRYLRKLFDRYLHLSPLEFLNRTRVNKAVELLRSTDLSVKEVCFACGFSSPQYFARVFKQHIGMTPKEASK